MIWLRLLVFYFFYMADMILIIVCIMELVFHGNGGSGRWQIIVVCVFSYWCFLVLFFFCNIFFLLVAKRAGRYFSLRQTLLSQFYLHETVNCACVGSVCVSGDGVYV